MRPLAISLLLVAACGAPAKVKSPAVALPVSQSADVSGCKTGASAESPVDPLGWKWSGDGSGWCRRSPDGREVERWIVDPSPKSRHLLQMEGKRASLTEAPPRLVRVQRASRAAAADCPRTPRLELFYRDNWVYMPRDLDCGEFRGDGFSVRAQAYANHGSPIPALRSIPDDGARATVVLIHGGPYRGVIRGLAGTSLLGYLLNHYGKTVAVSLPAYLGTDPIRYGPGGLSTGQAEISEVLRSEQAAGGGPVCVIAVSLGGFAAAGLVADHPSVNFLLAAPAASSAESFVARALSAGVPTPPRRLVQVEGQQVRQVGVPEDDAYLDYFGDLRRQSLAERLAPAARLDNWHILYSKDDIAIGQEAIAALRAEYGAARTTEVSGAGHAIEDPFNFPAYLPAIDGFLQRCLPPGGA